MKRFNRPLFKATDLVGKVGEEARSKLIFDWWCDEDDRKQYIDSLDGVPTAIRSRSPLQNDPAPSLDLPALQGFRDVFLISHPRHVHEALTNPDLYSNVPYAMLGGGTFLLSQDPTTAGVDWHREQREFITGALSYGDATLRTWARIAVEQAELTSLAQPDFDLALFAEQAALRYLGQLYGYAFQDHPLLEEASRATYRALQYVVIGQHFVTEPLTVPTAQQALGRLVTRTSDLMAAYTDLERSPRRFPSPSGAEWPVGVQPWSDLIPQTPDTPVLKRLDGLQSPMSGRDRAAVAATMLAGTVGNIQSAVCLLTQAFMRRPEKEEEKKREAERKRIRDANVADLEAEFGQWVTKLAPMTVVPRRTVKDVAPGGVPIKAGTDCLLILKASQGSRHDSDHTPCPHGWGAVKDGGHATHACLGRDLSQPLIAALVQRVLRLPGLKAALDPLTRETRDVERLWGFACTSYPLRFERERVRTQQNLIVAMRVKSPISENAGHLRRLIAAAVPRVDYVLTNFGHLHFAWFEFSDDDSLLVLRTIYDGDFEAYIQHFALRAGDIFDGLFEYLEGAPQRPVAEHPREFVEAIRRFDRAPLAGYLYSAYPGAEADQIRGAVGARP